MRKVDDGKRKEKRKKKRMAFLVATTSLPAVNRPNAGTPHARANYWNGGEKLQKLVTH